MKDGAIQKLADELYEAERDSTAILPLSDRYDYITVGDSYAIQMANIHRVEQMGYAISGKKIGLTSAGIQKQLGVDEPDYGHLFAAMHCEDGIVDTALLIQPKIEAELAFVLASDLTGENVTAADVRAATDYIVGAFEIVDSRIADWNIKLVDTIADNASSGRYILGKTRIMADETDLSSVTMRLYKNGELASEGTGAAVLGDPFLSVAWLANKLHSYGVALKKGEIILSGAFTAAPAAQKGDLFKAEFSTFGTIKAEFT